VKQKHRNMLHESKHDNMDKLYWTT